MIVFVECAVSEIVNQIEKLLKTRIQDKHKHTHTETHTLIHFARKAVTKIMIYFYESSRKVHTTQKVKVKRKKFAIR